MSTKKMSTARRNLRDLIGSEAESKATDAFCMAVDRAGSFAAPESAAEALPALQNAVLELRGSGFPELSAAEAPESLHLHPDAVGVLDRVRAALREAGEVGDAGAARLATLLAAPVSLLRDQAVREARERFYARVTPLRDELERRITSLFAVRSEAIRSAGSGGSPTQVCWLNGTLRSWTDPRALGSVAGDPQVTAIDVPRLLFREVGVTGRTVGAVRFRQGTGHDGSGLIVAVIDGEVSQAHPGFGGRVVHRMNYTQEPWGHPDPHATAVAGIIGAADGTLNGMSPGVKIFNYKVFAAPNTPAGTDFDAALALERALVDGARVANCSWGTKAATDGTSRETRAVENAWAAGMAVVKSAGNIREDGSNTVTAPADARGVIVVGATNREGTRLQSYSSRSETANGPRPHLVAPGGTKTRGVDSCLVSGEFGDCSWGTSWAAPHVTGLLALLLNRDPALTPDQQRAALLTMCASVPNAPVIAQGAGLVSL